MWSISCCWEGKGSVSTAGAGFDFRNWEISSRRGHSFEKWSPTHSRQGYFAFLFPLSLSLLVFLGFSYWFLGFLFLFLPFFLLLPEVWVLWMELTSVQNLRSRRSRDGSLGFLGRFFYWRGLDWTNNPIKRDFCWWLCRISAWVRSLRDQVIQSFGLGIDQV